jgi:hypothetical protein
VSDRFDDSTDRHRRGDTAIPDPVATGATILVTGMNDPVESDVCLHILSRLSRATDFALVVTTTESVEETAEAYHGLDSEADQPSLGVVDTASKGQSMAIPYGDTPVVYTPSPGDIERLIVALSQLSETPAPSSGNRHLVVRSLTPVLKATDTSLVCTALERIAGLPSDAGLCLLGIDFTAHDDETRAALTRHVDGILWVTENTDGELEFEYRPTKGRYNSSVSADLGE